MGHEINRIRRWEHAEPWATMDIGRALAALFLHFSIVLGYITPMPSSLFLEHAEQI